MLKVRNTLTAQSDQLKLLQNPRGEARGESVLCKRQRSGFVFEGHFRPVPQHQIGEAANKNPGGEGVIKVLLVDKRTAD